MRRITRDYLIYLVGAYILLAALIIAISLDHIPFWAVSAVLNLILFGLIWLFWGIYYLKRCESFDITLTTTFFIRKKNLEYYDTHRMVRDIGKMFIAVGTFALAGALAYLLTGKVETVTVDIPEQDILYSYSYFDGIIWIPLVTFFVIIVVLIGFFAVCRRSKYLKDPLVTPPKGDHL